MPTSQPETQSQPQQTNIDAAIRRAWRPLHTSLIALLIFLSIMIILYAIFGWNRAQDIERLGLLFFFFIAIILAPPFSIIFLCFVALSFSRALKIFHEVTEIKQKNKLIKILLTNTILGLVFTLSIGYSLIVILSIERPV